MKQRIAATILHTATPGRLAVLLGIAVLAIPSLNTGRLVVSTLGLGLVGLLTVVYAALRPTEWQLRQMMADEPIMVVPLRDSYLPWKKGGRWPWDAPPARYADPDGSLRAVELEMDRSVLVLGETGSGKSKAMEVLAHQMQSEPDEPRVVFDYKVDWQRFFTDTKRVSSVDSDVIWNVFLELEDEDDAKEIAAAVFSTAENNYFTTGAQQVFEDVLRLLHRWGEQDDYQPTNKDLVKYLKKADTDMLRDDLTEEDLSATKHLPEGVTAAKNIVSNLEMQVTEVFSGDFAKDGTFSIRQYMADPQGETLILDLPVKQSESVKPIFRFFVDYSIRFGMLDDRGAYYMLDEFASLPKLGMLERLVNAGRAYNCYAILGVQSVSQMDDTYGRDKAKSILSGLAQEIHLRVGEESVDYWRRRIGRERVVRGEEDNERVTEEHHISEREIQNLEAGDGVVHTTSGWQMGQLFMLNEVRLLPSEYTAMQRLSQLAKRFTRTESEDTVEEADRPAIEETDDAAAD